MFFRDRLSLFWMCAFPVAMSVFFFLAFSGITSDTNYSDFPFEKLPVAITGDYADNTNFTQTAEKSEMFVITYTDAENANALLGEGKINAVINISDKAEISMTVSDDGLEESIIKVFLDSYARVNSTVVNIISQNPEALTNGFIENMNVAQHYVEAKTQNKSNNMVIYFYSLLSMATLIGATLSSTDLGNLQANQTERAARFCIAPVKKFTSSLAVIGTTVFIHWFSTFVVAYGFMRLVLGIDFGENTLPIALLIFVGCFASVMIGALLCSIIKKSESARTGVLIGFSITSCFLSGMMSMTIKTLISENAPIVEMINPSSLMVNAMYSLYYYGINETYWTNLLILFGFGVVSLIGTSFFLSRQNYKSL